MTLLDPEDAELAKNTMMTVTLTRAELTAAATCLSSFLIEHAPLIIENDAEAAAVQAWVDHTTECIQGVTEMFTPPELRDLAIRLLSLGLRDAS